MKLLFTREMAEQHEGFSAPQRHQLDNLEIGSIVFLDDGNERFLVSVSKISGRSLIGKKLSKNELVYFSLDNIYSIKF